jgi:hypothetical protein
MPANVYGGRVFRALTSLCVVALAACSSPLISSQPPGSGNAQSRVPYASHRTYTVPVEIHNETNKVVRFLVYSSYYLHPWYKDSDLCADPGHSTSGSATYNLSLTRPQIAFTAQVWHDTGVCSPHLYSTPELNVEYTNPEFFHFEGYRYEWKVFDQTIGGEFRGYCMQGHVSVMQNGRWNPFGPWGAKTCTAAP